MTNFYQKAEDFLMNLADEIEKKDINQALDVEYSDGILSIIIEKTNQQYIINRNSGNQKIWYSSPFFGADYFSFEETSQKWKNEKAIELQKKLFEELKNIL